MFSTNIHFESAFNVECEMLAHITKNYFHEKMNTKFKLDSHKFLTNFSFSLFQTRSKHTFHSFVFSVNNH